MKRLVLLFVAVLVALPVVGVAAPAGAAKTDSCDLLSKAEASQILGYKVVATKLTKEKSTGAEQCEWRTKKYWSKDLKKFNAPYKLQVTTQPLTEEAEKTVATIEADSDTEAAPELGTRVMFDGSHDLLAVAGPLVIQIEVSNWTTEGGRSIDDLVIAPVTAAAKILIPVFEDVTK